MNKKTLIALLSVSSLIVLIVFLAIVSVYRNSGKQTPIFNGAEIGVLEVKGIILDSDQYLKKIKMLKKRDSVKAVIVRIDSPGGGIAASQEIYDELKKLDKQKPVIASMGSVAASGGYYIALGTRSIMANSGTLTGSIGVIMQLAYLEKLFNFIKVSPIVIKSGKYKDIGSSARKMTPEEKALLQDLSDEMHLQFKKAVAESRKLPMKYVDTIADARVFSGQTALKLKLIDKIGNFEEAVALATKLAGLKEEPELYYPKDKKESFLELFSEARTFLNKTLIESEQPTPMAM
jgi:protease-4